MASPVSIEKLKIPHQESALIYTFIEGKKK
jgi:hypothetical protein